MQFGASGNDVVSVHIKPSPARSTQARHQNTTPMPYCAVIARTGRKNSGNHKTGSRDPQWKRTGKGVWGRSGNSLTAANEEGARTKGANTFRSFRSAKEEGATHRAAASKAWSQNYWEKTASCRWNKEGIPSSSQCRQPRRVHFPAEYPDHLHSNRRKCGPRVQVTGITSDPAGEYLRQF